MTKAMFRTHFTGIYQQAETAGNRAMEACKPTPMVVSGMGKTYYVEDGVCGFAEVVIKPATTAFARFLKRESLAGHHYGGGISIWINAGGQSYDRKTAYAKAMAGVFQQHGIECYSTSRLD